MPKKSVIPQKFSKTDNLWVLPKICKSGQSDVGQSVVYHCIYGCVCLCKCVYGGGVDGRTMENRYLILIGIAF